MSDVILNIVSVRLGVYRVASTVHYLNLLRRSKATFRLLKGIRHYL